MIKLTKQLRELAFCLGVGRGPKALHFTREERNTRKRLRRAMRAAGWVVGFMLLLGCSGTITDDYNQPDSGAIDTGTQDPFGKCVFGGGTILPCLGPDGPQWTYYGGIACDQTYPTTANLKCIGLVGNLVDKEGATIP